VGAPVFFNRCGDVVSDPRESALISGKVFGFGFRCRAIPFAGFQSPIFGNVGNSGNRFTRPTPTPVNPEKYRLSGINPGVDFSLFGVGV
jgi:hypothetical protein